jgi:hypothetical protein
VGEHDSAFGAVDLAVSVVRGEPGEALDVDDLPSVEAGSYLSRWNTMSEPTV